MAETRTVVILGGSIAGLHIAHYLLKRRIANLKVVLVTKNSHFYWNLASVRAIIPGQIQDDQILQPIATALARYPAASYELVIGTAESSDFTAKTVTVAPLDGSGMRTIHYDHLVLATGARYRTEPQTATTSTAPADVPWKASGTYEELRALLHDTANRIANAQTIVVAGAGPTGVEIAGELGYEYGPRNTKRGGNPKNIILLTADAEILGGDAIAKRARAELQKLGVTVRTGTRVNGTRVTAEGQTEVLVQEGNPIPADVYLPTLGQVPNSDFLPRDYVSERGYVNVDQFFRVDGAESVWALGDIVSKPRAGFFITQTQAAGVGKNLVAVLHGGQPSRIKEPPVDILACSVGRSRGVGRAGAVQLPSVLVWGVKGRHLGLPRLRSYIDGSVA
ncbi:hypothetical protein VTK73DRAFT_9553 [Phialemonium thermophilum]|uniref:FAD/NAD(P)-binding domain-containing protein n=1 Tax=Phialemonium thermophilum TaxID=223376 RepID=A0ABR3W1S9_9PEZI